MNLKGTRTQHVLGTKKTFSISRTWTVKQDRKRCEVASMSRDWTLKGSMNLLEFKNSLNCREWLGGGKRGQDEIWEARWKMVQ